MFYFSSFFQRKFDHNFPFKDAKTRVLRERRRFLLEILIKIFLVYRFLTFVLTKKRKIWLLFFSIWYIGRKVPSYKTNGFYSRNESTYSEKNPKISIILSPYKTITYYLSLICLEIQTNPFL